jgi:RimJ/RimL family protein N-acetyltransferase
MSVSEVTRNHFEAAIREAEAAGYSPEGIARSFLSLVVSKYLETRSVSDVRAELIAAAENCDPDTDYPFMRP